MPPDTRIDLIIPRLTKATLTMSHLKDLLENYNIDPKKSLGQNFIHDTNMLEKIVSTADLVPSSRVVEVGPGTGALTRFIAEQAKQVIAVELDERMRPALEGELAQYDNVSLVFKDILDVNIGELVGYQDYTVVANIPYYITQKIIRTFLEATHRPDRMILTMQYEVADRICAEAGDMSILAVSVQYYGNPKIMLKIPPDVFYPRPDVESAVLRIDVHDKPLVDVSDDKTFFRMVRAGFSQKRKQLRNSLSGGLQIKSKQAGELLARAEIDPKRRAETLTIQEWAQVTRAYMEQ